jgi:hypothetical protein
MNLPTIDGTESGLGNITGCHHHIDGIRIQREATGLDESSNDLVDVAFSGRIKVDLIATTITIDERLAESNFVTAILPTNVPPGSLVDVTDEVLG